ncbi:hypothetical protein R1flu_006031 [Riccia fluitans]|uniref:Glycine-rich protein n=1 Tax=Riccia fluitans TaxID=41844 RepID=A0ABD1YYX5_9MARC
MAAAAATIAVAGCQSCALLNGGISRFPGPGNGNARRVSLAWDPLVLRSPSLRVFNVNLKRDGKRRIFPCRASAGDELEEEKVTETVEVTETNTGFMRKLGENLKDSISSAGKPAVALFLAGMLLLQPVDGALAASSGGRMGGRVFKSAPAPSRSYSGGGGGGRGGGVRIYNSPPIYGSPYGYGAPFGFSPFSPFGGGFYGGGGLLLGPSIGFGGGGFFFFAIIAFVTLRAISGFFRDRFGDRDDDFDD